MQVKDLGIDFGMLNTKLKISPFLLGQADPELLPPCPAKPSFY